MENETRLMLLRYMASDDVINLSFQSYSCLSASTMTAATTRTGSCALLEIPASSTETRRTVFVLPIARAYGQRGADFPESAPCRTRRADAYPLPFPPTEPERRGGVCDEGRALLYIVNVERLPLVHSTSFSGISCSTRSMKFWPLQCAGRMRARSNIFSAALTWRR